MNIIFPLSILFFTEKEATTTITTTLADMGEVTTPSPSSVDYPTSGQSGNHTDTGQSEIFYKPAAAAGIFAMTRSY